MKNLAVIDLETTGTDTVKDRICQIGVVIVEPTLLKIISKKEALINPTVPIPKGASDIHGITDEMVANEPTFALYAKSLFALLKECDILTFNGLRFDMPMLSEEFERVKIEWPLKDTCAIDAYVFFAEREKRDLSAAVKFYAGRDHEGAHGALADCLGTLDVLRGQMERYDDLAGLDVPALSKICMGNRVDLAGKIVFNDARQPVYGFGKDIGKTVKDNPGFAQWMLKNDFPSETKRVIKGILGWT